MVTTFCIHWNFYHFNIFLGHYNINETMVQSEDDNIIIELNDWNEFSNLDVSTNHPENS